MGCRGNPLPVGDGLAEGHKTVRGSGAKPQGIPGKSLRLPKSRRGFFSLGPLIFRAIDDILIYDCCSERMGEPMDKIKLSTDSTADIPGKFCKELDISVLPLTILTEGREYRDGVDISPSEFYKILEESPKLPTSAQVATAAYLALFEETWKAGFTHQVHVTIISKGSGTYQAAMLSRDMFFEEHPEAKEGFAIHLIDSKTYSMSYGTAVVEGAQLAGKGASVEEVIAHINDYLKHARPMFIPLDLKCVKKSGRISPAAAFVGDALGLKPLITFEDGEAKILSKARGEDKAIAMLLERCMQERRPGTNYTLVHGNNMKAFAKLKKACQKAMDIPPLAEYEVGCIIGINTGPNMVGILYRT